VRGDPAPGEFPPPPRGEGTPAGASKPEPPPDWERYFRRYAQNVDLDLDARRRRQQDTRDEE